MPQTEPIKILFLSANPRGTQKLDTSVEFRRVFEALQADPRFRLISHDNVSATQLQDLLKDEKPHILHFSGHGANRYGDLLTQSAYGDKETLPLDVLAKVIATLRGHLPLRFVVLNACWSLVMAEQLQKQVDAVIGMTDAIGDDAAPQFAEGFYSALRSGLSIKSAVDFGKDRIAINQLHDGNVPSFVVRPGLDPEKMSLDFTFGSVPEWEQVNLALSTHPKTNRPLLTTTLVGREDDLNWLKSGSEDKLLVGQPGTGKTFLFRKLGEEDNAYFVVNTERSALIASIRCLRPSY